MKLSLHRKRYFILIVSILMLLSKISFAQDETKDFKDVVNQLKKNPENKNNTELIVGKTYLSLLPVIGYAPANGFIIGGAVSVSKLLGNSPTSLSSGMLNCQVTSKRQFIANARSKVYLEKNKWFIQGDWRLLIFTQPTYGLGIVDANLSKDAFYVNNLPESSETVGEPMKYNHIRVYEEAACKLGDSHFYAGLGIAVDQHFNIRDERLDTVADSPGYFITSNYSYSIKNNFNPVYYGTNGVKFTLLTDTRDNISNCYSGYFVSISMIHNIKIDNNSQKSNQFLYDARYYLGLGSRNPRHLIAFWSWGSFLLNGNVPYLALPSIGWDTYNRSGRGFIQGRYRGLSMVYNEAEYRFPLSQNGLIGGTLFVNTTGASSDTQTLFDKTAFGFGCGFRVKLDKLARTNLTVDIGRGSNHSNGIYFNLQETF